MYLMQKSDEDPNRLTPALFPFSSIGFLISGDAKRVKNIVGLLAAKSAMSAP